jgi:hypothetical protein
MNPSAVVAPVKDGGNPPCCVVGGHRQDGSAEADRGGGEVLITGPGPRSVSGIYFV